MKKSLLTAGALAMLMSGSVFGQRNAIKVSPAQHTGNELPPHVGGRTCGTQAPSQQWDDWFNGLVEKYQQDHANMKTATVTSYTIPVVVHVIHSGGSVGTGDNISTAQINSQLTVLNQDYASAGLNNGNCPSTFLSAKANTGVTWCFATKDPSGNTMATPGIDRVPYTAISGLSAPGSGYSQTTIDNTIKPATIWDPTKYCNIWVLKLGNSLLGYATFPSGSGNTGLSAPYGGSTDDGVVILYSAFGNTGNVGAPYDKGRTVVHELGHWLGLRHIWGDSNCGTDYCNDTPPAQTANYSCTSGCTSGCFTHPYNVGGCSGNTTGEMTMNFMDYTDDACMYMFTNDQTTRIQTTLASPSATYRYGLNSQSATLCNVTPQAPVAAFSVPSGVCPNVATQFNDGSSNSPTSWLWAVTPSSGVTINTSSSQNPTITFPSAGSYTVSLTATNAQGNNTITHTVTVGSCAITCPDTISNYTSTDTLWYFVAGADNTVSGCSPKAGYVLGSNCYDDKEKAEWYDISKYNMYTNAQISGVIVLFYKEGTKGTGGSSGTAVNMKIYNGTLAGGPSGTALATVNSTLGTITGNTTVNNVTYAGDPTVVYASNMILPYRFALTSPLTAPTTNGFFASVTIPTTSGDTAVILNNVAASSGTTWEKWSDNTWHDVNTAWGGLLVNAAILPEITCTTTGIMDPGFSNHISLYPNPNNGTFNLIFTLPKSTDISLTVTNTLGQVISSRSQKNVSNQVLEFDLGNYARGMYYINVTSGDGHHAVYKVITE